MGLISNPSPNNQRSCYVNQRNCDFVNGLVEKLVLTILETKAGHDGLYDEMINIYISNYYL